jgi:hypothetical protein
MSNRHRVERLEGLFTAVTQAAICSGCSYRHARPVGMELIRQCIGVGPAAPPRLCICACCADHAFLVELSHGHHWEVA